MGYEAALEKAWDAISGSNKEDKYLRFINDEYKIDYRQKSIVSIPHKNSAKDYYKLLILHYLANESKVSEINDNHWISFKELEGGEAYFPAFKKRATDPILKKYDGNPSDIFRQAGSFNAEKLDAGSAGISINAFPKIKIAIILWARDDEFTADCSMLFNPEIKQIFPTEDVAVLGGITASLL